jgi:hypothetical protein
MLGRHDMGLETSRCGFESRNARQFFRSLGVMVAHVESDPDKDTIQQPIHSIHKDEIGVRIPGAPPIQFLSSMVERCFDMAKTQVQFL